MMKQVSSLKSQRGFTVVEVLVASLIGLLSVYAVYTVYGQHEQVHRSNESLTELQLSGLHSMFLLEQMVNDAGSGMMYDTVFKVLEKCPKNEILPKPDVSTAQSLSLRPVPVVIEQNSKSIDGETVRRDAITVYTGAPRAYGLIDEVRTLKPNESNSFSMPFNLKEKDVLVAVNANGSSCHAFRVDNPVRSASGATMKKIDFIPKGESVSISDDDVINLGYAARYQFWVDDQNVLQMAQYELDDHGKWQSLRPSMPIATNVMEFAAQYGVDTNNDNMIDLWLDGNTAGWKPADLQAATADKIKQIKAVRVGVIARFDDPERLTTERLETQPATGLRLSLFKPDDCRPSGASCDNGQEVIFTYRAKEGPGETSYRYRQYETMIPLRNTIWNPETT